MSLTQRRPSTTEHGRGSPLGRRVVAGLAALVVPVSMATVATAATEITVKNPGQLVQAGPVDASHGFPTWYEDKSGVRLEPCLDHTNPLCGIPADEVPNPSAPVSFPNNFPGEFFYQLVEAELPLRGGGTASLVLGLEGAWLNEVVNPGEQTVFARVRVDVDDAAPGTTFRFKHPFGELTVDTDATGRGRFVQDVSPALGNFDTPLAGNLGPFLKWRPGVLPAPPAGYLGNPDVLHQVTGSPTGFNRFTAWQGSLQEGTTDLFSISGKVAVNTGLKVDLAAVNGTHLDVFTTSKGSALEVVGQDGRFATTPMEHDPGSDRFYVRIPLQSGATAPTEVTVRNLSDKPVSSSTYKINGVSVSQATYDGTNLTVAASAVAPASYPLTVVGIGTLDSAAAKTFAISAPPATVTVKDASGATGTMRVSITDGPASPGGTPPTDPGPDPGPVTDPGGGGGTETPATVPGAPTLGAVTAGNASAVVNWTAPASDGGSAVTGYRITAVPVAPADNPGAVLPPTVTANAGATATTVTLTTLVNGQRYNVRVRAINSAGVGDGSLGKAVTPTA
ncbi:fibronectin type III domain-containing protein [Geodermatophilus sp. CPCC 205506]|uniref:fibronectin type III domain-containing protein n=1 Tax=Geodermatophilus sp. CPCC 205506 TaxID=2936596 RepID=UPI003EEB7CD1